MRKARIIGTTIFACAAAALFVVACDNAYSSSDNSVAPTNVDAAHDGRSADGGALTDGSVAIDPTEAGTSDAAPACDPNKPFGAAIALSALNSAGGDGRMQFIGDTTRVYFESDREGGVGAGDIYTATSSGPSSFGPVALVSALSSTSDDGNPSPSADGALILFSSGRVSVNLGYNLFSATANGAGGFSAPLPITALNSDQNDGQPFLRHDGAEVYFISDRNGSQDIFRAAVSPGTFGAPTPVNEVNSADTEFNPVISVDGKTIYFASNRAGATLLDVYRATRASGTGTFGAPELVPELNTSANDSPDYLSTDGCTIYFQSDRAPTQGGMDLYIATKPQ